MSPLSILAICRPLPEARGRLVPVPQQDLIWHTLERGASCSAARFSLELSAEPPDFSLERRVIRPNRQGSARDLDSKRQLS